MALSCLCSAKFLVSIFLSTAIPLAYIISVEQSTPTTHVFHYHSSGFLRECAKWDPLNRRFLVSMMEGGVGQIVPANEDVLSEVVVVRDAELSGNASLGLLVDPPRNRLLVVSGDLFWNKFSALAAYDLSTWRRLFLTVLSGPEDGKAFADDVAVDGDGNAYVTDVKSSKIWKVSKDGELLATITSRLFSPHLKQWYKNLLGLNGIVYHPDGFLIVIHTQSGTLFKIDISRGSNGVSLIAVSGGSLAFGDGMELLSPTQIVVSGFPHLRLVESLDEWRTAKVISTFRSLTHRIPSAATVKDGRIYVNHILGLGYPRKRHAIVEAVFS